MHFCAGNQHKKNATMICVLTTDLDWLFASRCHVVSENTKAKAAETAAEIHLSAPLCAEWLFFLCLLVAHRLFSKRGQGQSYCEFQQNKRSTMQCCITNGEQ